MKSLMEKLLNEIETEATKVGLNVAAVRPASPCGRFDIVQVLIFLNCDCLGHIYIEFSAKSIKNPGDSVYTVEMSADWEIVGYAYGADTSGELQDILDGHFMKNVRDALELFQADKEETGDE